MCHHPTLLLRRTNNCRSHKRWPTSRQHHAELRRGASLSAGNNSANGTSAVRQVHKSRTPVTDLRVEQSYFCQQQCIRPFPRSCRRRQHTDLLAARDRRPGPLMDARHRTQSACSRDSRRFRHPGISHRRNIERPGYLDKSRRHSSPAKGRHPSCSAAHSSFRPPDIHNGCMPAIIRSTN